MVAPIYTNRKGIYSDLYREIDAENKKKEASIARKPKKGIYVELYKQIEFKNNERKKDSNNFQSNLYVLALKKLVRNIFSSLSYFFSSARREVKVLIVACIVAKEPINSYIENNLQTYQNQ